MLWGGGRDVPMTALHRERHWGRDQGSHTTHHENSIFIKSESWIKWRKI